MPADKNDTGAGSAEGPEPADAATPQTSKTNNQIQADREVGAAASSGQPRPEGGYTAFQAMQRLREKQAIAKYVVDEIIEGGMSILLDAGSTVHQVGQWLFGDESGKEGLTIMTNNMLVFHEFNKRSSEMSKRGNVLALTGGVYYQNHEALFGQAPEVLTSFNPRVVVIGTSGFVAAERHIDEHDKQGAFHHDPVSEVVTKTAISRMRTIHRVIVCDYSKVGVWDATCFAPVESLGKNTDRCTIITNIVPSELTEHEKERYEKRYDDTLRGVKKWSRGTVELIRVDSKGREA